jgi:hypothetical protein
LDFRGLGRDQLHERHRIPLGAAPAFSRLVRSTEAPSSSSSITVRAGGVIVEVRPGFDPALLREVVAALVERPL